MWFRTSVLNGYRHDALLDAALFKPVQIKNIFRNHLTHPLKQDFIRRMPAGNKLLEFLYLNCKTEMVKIGFIQTADFFMLGRENILDLHRFEKGVIPIAAQD